MTARNSALTALSAIALATALPACAENHNEGAMETLSIEGSDGTMLTGTVLEEFGAPWAMTFLPDDRALVTEKTGELWLLNKDGSKAGQITNVPAVDPRGQGGLGDIVLGQNFDETGTVYISFVERDEEDDELSGAAVEKATLTLTEDGGELSDREVIWRQSPKVTGNGHYSHRLAVSSDGYLFITSGERQKFTPAQNMDMNLGKIVRLTLDGEPVESNPFYGNGGVADQIWSLGHRNLLGIDFDAEGNLWTHEMGPRGGDELNFIVKGENYGYPEVSDGVHYSGEEIPDHDTNPAYENPAISWVPAISPAGLIMYKGDMFEDWKGNAFIGGLSSQALIRVEISEAPVDNNGAAGESEEMELVGSEAARYEWDKRIREVEEGPDGAIYVLEDTRRGSDIGRLIKLTPAG